MKWLCDDCVIHPSDQRNNFIEAINVILDFNETIQLDLVWKYKNQRIKKWASDFNWWIQSKIIEYFMSLKKIIFFFCMYKMYLISAEGYENANVDFLTIKTTSEIWVSMKDVISDMGVKNISDLVLNEIYGICETKNPTEKEVNEYKMTKRKINKKFTNLSEKELNTKNNKQPYVRNDVMTTIIKRCRGEKKWHKSNWGP